MNEPTGAPRSTRVADNPYQPPMAYVEDAPTRAVSPKARRPVAVGLLQAVVLVVAVGLAAGSARMGYRLIDVALSAQSLMPLALAVIWRAAVSAALAIVVLQVHRRARAGRMLGLLVIALFILGMTMHLIEGWAVGASVGSMIGWGGPCLAMLALLLWWAHSFGFSRASQAYFVPKTATGAAFSSRYRDGASE